MLALVAVAIACTPLRTLSGDLAALQRLLGRWGLSMARWAI
ncbi:hypothetical protein O0544_07860 [Edwardsiella anguillarum]|nr:hypothetical protein [Edwardsiella anguillarum]